MSEELDMEALGREWRKIDMKTIEMALETGKLRREFTWSFVYSTGVGLLIGSMLVRLAFFTTQPWSDRWPAVVIVGVVGVAFLWFFRRQWRAVQAADLLLTGTPTNLIRGRRALLKAELYNWDSRFSRLLEFWAGPCAILFVTVAWWLGYVSVWVPLVGAGVLASLSAYSRLYRIPWVRAEITKLDRLERTLA